MIELTKILKYINLTVVLVLLIFVLISTPNVCTLAQEVETLENQTQDKIKLQAILTPPYVIGPGDQLAIIDRTLRELTNQIERYDVVVSSDGYISVPLPDGKQENIIAAGHTLDELSNTIRDLFAQTLKNPLIYLQITRYRPINVYLGGEVIKPGIYKFETTSTTDKGITTTNTSNIFGLSVTQALQLAGGLKPKADISSIILTRGTSSEKRTIDLKALITGNSTLEDITLQPGDALFIPTTSNTEVQAQTYLKLLGKLAYQENPISVTGEVLTPGNFILPNDATIFDAIGMAGGINVVGTLKKVWLSRFDKDGMYKTKKLDLDKLLKEETSFNDIVLEPNDRIYVEHSYRKELRHFFRDIAD